MKSHIPGLFALLLMFASCKPTVRFGTHSLEQVVKTMSLGEKSSIIMGYAMEGTDSLYKTAAIERLGIPSVVISDKRTEWEFDAGYLYSWNTALMENLGYDAGRLRSREGIEIIREPHPESVSALYNHKDSHVQVESMRKSYTRGFERGFRGTFLDTAFIINGSAELQRSIQDSVTNGELAMADLDERVMAALTMISRSVANRSKVISNVDSTKHQVLIDLLNAESAVLLRNAGTLPLSPSHKRIALYGVDSYEGLDTELEKSGFTLEPSVKSYTHSVKGGAAATRKPFQYRADAIAAHLAVITFISPEMETAHEELISSICTAFHEKNKNVVLLLSVERPKSLSPSVLQAGAVLYIPELDSNKYITVR